MPIYTLLQGKRSILKKKCQKLRKRKTNTKAIILDIVHRYRFKTQMLTFWFLMVTTQWQMLLVHTVKPVGLLVCFVLCCHPSPLSSSLPRPPYSKQRRNYPHPVQLFDAVAFTTHNHRVANSQTHLAVINQREKAALSSLISLIFIIQSHCCISV